MAAARGHAAPAPAPAPARTAPLWSLHGFLRVHGLERYAVEFGKNGFDSMDLISNITMDDMATMGLDLAHRRKLHTVLGSSPAPPAPSSVPPFVGLPTAVLPVLPGAVLALPAVQPGGDDLPTAPEVAPALTHLTEQAFADEEHEGEVEPDDGEEDLDVTDDLFQRLLAATKECKDGVEARDLVECHQRFAKGENYLVRLQRRDRGGLRRVLACTRAGILTPSFCFPL